MERQSFEEVKAKWDVVFKDPLLSLTSLREKGVKGNICSQGLRSVFWKLYLAYLPSLDTATWPLTLHKERQHYANLRQKYIINPASESENDGANDLSVNNPLSLDQANPWQEYFKDTELRKIIRQDVERTFPDNPYFRTSLSQSRLLDILFIYCKMNQDVSYRQGMHELLAPILWIVDKESIPSSNEYAVENGEDTIIKQTLNADYVEHDTFALFSALMKAAKVYYEYNDEVFNRRPIKRAQGTDLEYARIIKDAQAEAAKLTPVVMKCSKIYDEYLRTIDSELYKHLKDLDIEPQLYGIRWIRLLFGREFPLNQVLILWDGMFAEDPTLRIVDFVCIAMMLLIRDELLVSDYAGCLSMLMRYPPTTDVEVLVPQAIFLRDHLTPEGGASIIQDNALRIGKILSVQTHPLKETHKIEGLVQEGFVHVTKNVLESRGAVAINKAILSAVGEVKVSDRNVLRKQDGQIRSEYDKRNYPSSVEYSQRYAQSNHSYNHVDPLRSEIPKTSEEITKLKDQNRQIALVVQKSIEILEQEILGRAKLREITSAADAEKIEKSSDGSESRSSFEYISGNNNEDSTTLSPNEISVLHVLHGLKHIRDVLNGFVKEFNPHIMEISSHNGDDHDHWEVVDDGVSVVSVAGTEDETASVTKEIQTNQDKITTLASSSTTSVNAPKAPISETISTKHVQTISTPPLQPSPPPSTKVSPSQVDSPPQVSPSQKVASQQRSNINKLAITSLSRSPSNEKFRVTSSVAAAPKSSRPISISIQKSKLRLEDILNDMEKSGTGSPKSSIASNSKYSWMIEGYTDDDDNSLFNPKRASIGSINSLSGLSSDFSKDTDDDVFKSISTPNQRRTRNSSIVSSLYSERIDPLGASPFAQKNMSRERSESIGSASSSNEKRSSSHIFTTNTPVVPVDDPLGIEPKQPEEQPKNDVSKEQPKSDEPKQPNGPKQQDNDEPKEYPRFILLFLFDHSLFVLV
ncbi:19489_t:CDS:10 [Funneliformis geosporum]|uniref:19489_t:CDS:1 n=1 Tax=Funneliformis geosporum TaxID=1117311 RepID=A0A9W4SI54_9GLOM|nr:19489_t:CDS:10 [Funneliformis geosporum]